MGRVNQKARTRAALLAAAVDLVREGRPPSVPDAAERALVSVATAYRYFPTAEELWVEASYEMVDFRADSEEGARLIDAAGDDPAARLEAVITSIGWRMLEDPIPFRMMAKFATDRWFEQQRSPEKEGALVRQGRRDQWNQLVVEPLRGTLTGDECDQLVAALNVTWGTEAAISLTDVSRLDVEQAKAVMLQTARWVLAGALADAKARKRRSVSPKR